MTLVLSGISVSKGIALGPASVLTRNQPEIPKYDIPSHLINAEVARYHAALRIAMGQLGAIRDHIPKHTPPDIAAFIDTHILMLNDPTLSEGPAKLIAAHSCNAEWALKLQRDMLVNTFDEMEDPYLCTRKDDVDHVVERIVRALLNQSREDHHHEADRFKGRIIVAEDLSPADTIFFQHHHIAAIIAERGGPTSHMAILARSLGIPALLGVTHARQLLRDDEPIIVDGTTGVVIAGADRAIERHYRAYRATLKNYRASLNRLRGKPTVTRDNHTVTLFANIDLPDDVYAVNKAGATGIGLYRTEFLFMDRKAPPDEDEQYQIYARVVKSIKDLPVTIRTLDAGGDKPLDPHCENVATENPALGLRGIRFSLKDPTQFKTQLRAILRAARHGHVRIMIPMLTSLSELTQARALLHEASLELKARREKYSADVALGCMIETPAAAMLIERIARAADFVSIGTNDLIQYTLAVDRTDTEVSHLYDPLHPAVLQFIAAIIAAGKKAKRPVTLCGEMAGDARYTRLLLALGLRHFSMHASSLLEVKHAVHQTSIAKLRVAARNVLLSTDAEEAQTKLDQLNALP